MNRLYILLLFVLVLGLAYMAGMHAGTIRCREKYMLATSNQQTKIIKIQGKINAETVRRTGDDIRRVPREKYTIAE